MTTSATTQEPTPQETPGGDRVREHSDPHRLQQDDAELRQRVRSYIGKPDEAITSRIRELECESDMERVLAANASTLALLGVLGGLFLNRRFFLVPLVVLTFLLQHAIQGWCPPLPLFRRLGVRSRQEIDAERYALKALRGDFAALTAPDSAAPTI
jgi:hypothetical protein